MGDDETRKRHNAHVVEKGEESLARGLSAVKNGCSRCFESFKAKMSNCQVCLPYLLEAVAAHVTLYYDREQGYHFNHIEHRVTGEHFALPESELDWNEFQHSHPPENITTWSTADNCRSHDFCMPCHTENNPDIVASPTESLTCPTLSRGSKRDAVVISSSESTVESTEPTSTKKAKTEKGYLYVHNLNFSKKQAAVLASADTACGTELHKPLTEYAKIGFTDSNNINDRLSAYKTSSSIPEHQKFLTINTVDAHQKEQEVLDQERKSGNTLRGEWVHMGERENPEEIVNAEINQVDEKDRKWDIKKDHHYEPEQKRRFIYGADLLRWIDIGICDLDTIVQKIKDGYVRIWTE